MDARITSMENLMTSDPGGRNAEAIAEELRKHPPLTIVGRIFADRTIGIGVRLDTSMCLRPDGKESGL